MQTTQFKTKKEAQKRKNILALDYKNTEIVKNSNGFYIVVFN